MMKRIGGLFGRSPFGPLHEHMAKVQECVERMPELVDRFLAADWETCRRQAKVISRVEHEADTIKQSIRSHLTKSIFSSVERSEILMMLKTQDAVADRCEDVGYLLVMRKTPFPAFLTDHFVKLTALVKETADRLAEVTRDLHHLYDDSGTREDTQRILDKIDKIHVVEHQADEIEDDLRLKLFERESEVDPVTIIILLDIFTRMGDIADAAENVSDAVRSWIETR